MAVTTAVFVGFTGFTLVMPFLPIYFRQLGVTDVGDIALWSGVTLGATPAITAMCAPLWGRVGDRFGNKLLVQRSLLSFILVMVAMAYVTQPWHLFALRAVQGLFAGYGPLALSMAALSAPREKMALAIGTVQTAQRMGPALGPIIGGVLAPFVGLRNSFLVAAVFYAVAFVVLTVLYTEPPVAARTVEDEQRTPFTTILAFENFLLLMLVIFGLQVVDRSFGPVLPLYLGQLGYTPEDVLIMSGVLFSVLAFAGALGNQLAAHLLTRVSPRTIVASNVLVAAAALILFTLTSSSGLLIVSMSMIGLCIGTATTTAFAAAGAVIPRNVHATGFGFLTTASLAGLAVSPVLSGLVAGQSIRVVFVTGVAALVGLAVIVRRLMVERPLGVETSDAAAVASPSSSPEP